MTERWGGLLRFALTGGRIDDCTRVPSMLEGLRPRALLADRGDDSHAVMGHLQAACIEPVIPGVVHCAVQRPCDVRRHRDRNRIGRLFPRLKPFRRIATRCDRAADRFASFVALGATVPRLR